MRAFAPASVSNITCGFDLLGFAVESWGDIVEARATPEPGVHLRKITGDGGRLPTEARENTAGVAALELLAAEGNAASSGGVELRLHKGLPLASGLGSSAASGVAAAVAVNEALRLDAGVDRLLAAAVEGERVACGTPHPDNAAPSLCGGLLLARPGVPTVVTQLRVPGGLTCVLLHPHCEVATEMARAALPATVPLSTLVLQAGNLAALVAGLLNEDYDLIASAMVDQVAEPVRAAMTPGFEAVRHAALAAGALGCGLSGSGPTLFAWARSREEAAGLEAVMLTALHDEAGLDGDTLISPVGAPGARILTGDEPEKE
ncbi:MAG: homoserine kinase [bacterium]|nr:homoserine kinase [bacterium]